MSSAAMYLSDSDLEDSFCLLILISVYGANRCPAELFDLVRTSTESRTDLTSCVVLGLKHLRSKAKRTKDKGRKRRAWRSPKSSPRTQNPDESKRAEVW
jgi:hypothetical protein